MNAEFKVVIPSDIGRTIQLGVLEADKYDVVEPIKGFTIDDDACLNVVTAHDTMHQVCLAPTIAKFIPEPCPVDATSYKVVKAEVDAEGVYSINESTVAGVKDVDGSDCKQVVIPQHRASTKLTNVTGSVVLGYIHIAEEGYEVL